ncbi:MAG: DUF4129 domain-containing protein [Myxococcota bacterium]
MILLHAVLLASLSATDLGGATVSTAEQEAARVVADYAFCTDPEYPLNDSERRWCPLAEEAIGRCPALKQACAAEPAVIVDEGESHRFGSRRVAPRSDRDERARPPEPKRRRSRSKGSDDGLQLPSLGGFGQVLFWIVLGVAVLALGIAIARNTSLGRRRDEPEPEPDDTARDDDEREPIDDVEARVLDADRLLAQARDFASSGRWLDAIERAHAALLRRLDRRGEIRLHRSRTTGDYLRELRAHPELRGPVREALREIDRAYFGGQAPDQTVFESILARVQAVLRQAGSTALVWALIIMGLGCGAISDALRYRWDESPSGFGATIEFLQELGADAEYATEPLDQIEHPLDAVVIASGAELSPSEWDALEQMVHMGGLVVVVGGEHSLPWSNIDTWSISTPPADRNLPAWYQFAYSDDLALLWVPDRGVLRSDDAGYPTITRGDSIYGMSWQIGNGEVLVLPNLDALSSVSLAMPGNAVVIEELLGAPGLRVRFIDSWTMEGASSPTDSIANSHLTAAVLQLLLVMGLLYWWRGVRFGRPRGSAPPSRRAFTRHAKAMARVYGRAGALPHAAAAYSTWALDRLRASVPHTAGPGLEGMARALARRTGRDETEIVRLLVEAHTAAEQGTVDDDEEARRIIRGLMALMNEDHS